VKPSGNAATLKPTTGPFHRECPSLVPPGCAAVWAALWIAYKHSILAETRSAIARGEHGVGGCLSFTYAPKFRS